MKSKITRWGEFKFEYLRLNWFFVSAILVGVFIVPVSRIVASRWPELKAAIGIFLVLLSAYATFCMIEIARLPRSEKEKIFEA